MSFDVDWVDAFTDRAFGGNGCAVVHDGASLDDATCMAFVRETSLVECTFTGPSDVADIRVRYFLASREIPFAGHPTVATVAAMRHRGLIGDGPLTLETQAGIVPVEVTGTSVRMTQIAPEFGAYVPAEVVAAGAGLIRVISFTARAFRPQVCRFVLLLSEIARRLKPCVSIWMHSALTWNTWAQRAQISWSRFGLR